MKPQKPFETSDALDNSPWIEMRNVDWSCITKGISETKYKKNEMIYYQQDIPDFVYLVKKGRVRLDILGFSGEQRSLFISEAGTFFGELSPIDCSPNMCSATAATDSILYAIPKTKFLEMLNTNHEFSLNILKMMSKKIRLITNSIKQLSFNDSRYRVCCVLLNLVNQYSNKNERNHYRLNIKFTHQEMANLTGLSRVSVSNILSGLANEGIIDKSDGFIIIKNIEALNIYLSEDEV